MKYFINICIASLLSLCSFLGAANDAAPSAKRAIISSAIEAREPTDNLNDKTIPTTVRKVYLFSEILNNANASVTHRWFRNGKLEAEIVLNTGSNRWRTNSSKNLDPTFHTGQWEVMVVASDGTTLATQTFTYGE
jgi:hypothetical protein